MDHTFKTKFVQIFLHNCSLDYVFGTFRKEKSKIKNKWLVIAFMFEEKKIIFGVVFAGPWHRQQAFFGSFEYI
jgi:hypothetical protein